MRVSPHPPPIGALHHRRPRAGPDCGQLREEPAVTGLDGSFATSPGSSDRIARQDRFGPPPPIQGASAYPGLDRPVSGLAAVTPGAFTPGPWPLSGLRASRFRSGFVTLTSPQRQTPWPVIQDGRHDPAYHPSRRALRPSPSGRSIPFEPCPPIATQFQALFTPLPGYFSAFPRGTASAIGLGTYLGLEVGTPSFPCHIQGAVLRIPPLVSCTLAPTGLSPSMARRSRRVRLRVRGIGGGPTTPHPQWVSPPGSVCPLPPSLAGTEGIAIAFSSCPY